MTSTALLLNNSTRAGSIATCHQLSITLRTDFKITILGSGAALPLHDRNCSAQAVCIRGFRMLLDCGEGTQTQIRHNHIKLQSISLICVSHLHGDHFFGLPPLLSTMHLCGRTTPLTIVGPAGIKELIENINAACGNHLQFDIEFVELTDMAEGSTCQVYECKDCVISAFPLRHTMPCYGYLITEQNAATPARRYAYCCDTAPYPMLADTVRGVDLLCMESTFDNQYAEAAGKFKHSTAAQAAQTAAEANVKRLLLTHFSARYKESVDPLIEQAQQHFADTIAAEDNMTLLL